MGLGEMVLGEMVLGDMGIHRFVYEPLNDQAPLGCAVSCMNPSLIKLHLVVLFHV
jgi:hypothetical protein